MKINTLDFDAQALRDRIFDLAMKGKLVPQNPNDEPVSTLLAKIKTEKNKLIQEKKIKKSKKLSEITDDEKPFDIPDSWEWVRLGDVSQSIKYGFTASAQSNGNSKLLRITDIQDGKVNWSTVPFCDVPDNKIKGLQLSEGDILIARTGGTIGKSFNIQNVPGPAVFASYLIRVKPMSLLKERYIPFVIKSPMYWSFISEKKSGTGQPNVNATKLGEFVFPLPPLEEQKRIANKISQLFDQINKIESASQQYTELRSSLKSKVLDVAMHGKLVEQDPTDEPASVLFDKIKAEKDKLIKQKKIKKSKPLPEITEDEKPFGIPDSWEWVRVGEIISIYNGKAFKASDWSPQGLPIVRIQNLNDASATYHYYNGKVEDKFHLLGGELLFAWSGTPGTSFGAHIWKQQEAVLNQHIFKISFDERRMNKQYLAVVLNFRILSLIKEAHGSAGLRHITKKMFESTIIPIPPLNEQKRIVTKLKKLSNAL
ncbi:restriction endonuclease subunit S [Limosilactobacillus reuteri]|uniref:restriction endonuclease subunit S n=1 Tax=Limosilactobacillus reuteri TaxID=1598 RepID=UPI000A2E6006|nr:restriction endonuclease subunit S [Limosilactobacillus reuteri]OTA46164.1 hypothetical protein BHL74_00660 [Limosilactobacillus reuteri]